MSFGNMKNKIYSNYIGAIYIYIGTITSETVLKRNPNRAD